MTNRGLTGSVSSALYSDAVADDLLFHYTKADTLRLILGGRTVHLGPYSKTNDPREQKEWAPLFTMPTSRSRPDERYLAQDDPGRLVARQATDRYLRQGARLACFTVDREPSADAALGMFFHRGWARARMWEQYADSHRGACLVFDRYELIELIELVDGHRPHGDGDLFTYGAVTYQDRPLVIRLPWMEVVDQGIDAVLDDFQVRKNVARELYTIKNTDWHSEQEFRIVCVRWGVPDDQVDDPVVIPFGTSLKCAVLGEHFPNAADIRREGQLSGIDVKWCQWYSGVPILV